MSVHESKGPRLSGELTLTRADHAAVRVEGRGDRLAIHADSLADLRAAGGLFASFRSSLPSLDPSRAPWWPPATVLLAGRPVAEFDPQGNASPLARLVSTMTDMPVTRLRPLALLRATLG